MFSLKAGDWVQYKGKFARVHGATKTGRHLIEVLDHDRIEGELWISREWVKPLSITVLDPAVGSILESINNFY